MPPESELSFHHCAPQNVDVRADGGVFVADDEVFRRARRSGQRERRADSGRDERQGIARGASEMN